jgi:hypothetical protein
VEISRLVPDDNKEEEAEESPEKPHFTALTDISMFGHRLSTQLFSFTSYNSEQLCNTKFFALYFNSDIPSSGAPQSTQCVKA